MFYYLILVFVKTEITVYLYPLDCDWLDCNYSICKALVFHLMDWKYCIFEPLDCD